MGPAVPQLNKTTSAGIVERAGMPQLRQLNMVNIEMFRHPKYYKELRKRALDERNRDLHVRPISGSVDSATDQAISKQQATASSTRAPGPGLKLQASSVKLQAVQASSDKHQAPSNKRQASSRKRQAAQ